MLVQLELKLMVLNYRYEDMKVDRVKEVTRVLDFLKIPYSDSDIVSKLKDDYATFVR